MRERTGRAERTPRTRPAAGERPARGARARPFLAGVLLLPWLCMAGACHHVVTIKSDPPGALVTDLNHGEICRTPCRFQVERGDSLHLTFDKDGYWGEKKDVFDIKRNTTVMATLRTYPTLLFVKSLPAGATLRVFDAATGEPVELTNPSKIATDNFFTNRAYEISSDLREVNLVLEKRGYNTLRHTVKVEPCIENRFSFELKQIIVKLRITTDPSGANVYERSRGFIGRTPLDLDLSWEQLAGFSRLHDAYSMDAVDLHLTLSKDGYAPEEITKKLHLYHDNPPLNVVLKPATD